jgi:hypothetical protein
MAARGKFRLQATSNQFNNDTARGGSGGVALNGGNGGSGATGGSGGASGDATTGRNGGNGGAAGSGGNGGNGGNAFGGGRFSVKPPTLTLATPMRQTR